MEIAFFDQKYSTNETWDIINKLGLQNRFKLYRFNQYDDIKRIYEANKNHIGGILFPTAISYNYFLAQAGLLSVPITYVGANFERHFLSIIGHLLNSQIPLNQVYIDTFDNNDLITDLHKYIPKEQMPEILYGYDCFNPNLMDFIYQHIRELWERRRIKMAYVGYEVIFKRLSEAGIPCQYVRMSEEPIIQGIYNIIRQVDLKNKYNNNSIVVLIDFMNFYQDSIDADEIEYRRITLNKVLVNYRRQFGKNSHINISPGLNYLEMNFSREFKDCDDNHMLCKLIDYISENYEFIFTVGVGMGNNLTICRDKAFKALHFANCFGEKSSFSMEDEVICGPLNLPGTLKFTVPFYEENKKEAKKLNIDSHNYTRVITLFNQCKNNISAGMIAECLNITMRSTNRIIAVLLNKQIIKEQERAEHYVGRGRPPRLYEKAF